MMTIVIKKFHVSHAIAVGQFAVELLCCRIYGQDCGHKITLRTFSHLNSTLVASFPPVLRKMPVGGKKVVLV